MKYRADFLADQNETVQTNKSSLSHEIIGKQVHRGQIMSNSWYNLVLGNNIGYGWSGIHLTKKIYFGLGQGRNLVRGGGGIFSR